MIHPFENAGLKALSVALAALLWFTVSRDQVVERTLRVPLEYQNVPDGLVIMGDPPATVDVRVRGPSSALGRLESGEVVSVLDLRSARPGARLFHLITEQVRAPFGIEVVQVAPPTVPLTFERGATKSVPVHGSVEGVPAPGYVIGDVQVEPSTVQVTGPESRLQGLTEATTEPISVEGATRNVRDQVTIGVTDSAVRLVQPSSATVDVAIVPAPVARTVEDVPIEIRHVGRGLDARVTPSLVDVVVRGAKESIAPLDKAGVRIYVDAADLTSGRYTLVVKSEPGEGYSVVRTEPESVQLTIR